MISLNHLRENRETYFSHMKFAFKVGAYLGLSSFFFLIHSIFPFLDIPRIFNIEANLNRMKEWSDYTKKRIDS